MTIALIIFTIIGAAFLIWALFLDKEPVEKQENQYLVDAPSASHRNTIIVILFLVALGVFAVIMYFMIDNAIAPKLAD